MEKMWSENICSRSASFIHIKPIFEENFMFGSEEDQKKQYIFRVTKVILALVFYFLFCVLISNTIKYVGVLQALYKNKMLFVRQNNLHTKIYSASFSEIIKTA